MHTVSGSLTSQVPFARRRPYDLYLYLVMTVEWAYRNYPTTDIENFGRHMLASVLNELGLDSIGEESH